MDKRETTIEMELKTYAMNLANKTVPSKTNTQ